MPAKSGKPAAKGKGGKGGDPESERSEEAIEMILSFETNGESDKFAQLIISYMTPPDMLSFVEHSGNDEYNKMLLSMAKKTLLMERAMEDLKTLKACLGVFFDKNGDAVVLDRLSWNSAAHLSGLEQNDRLLSMTGIKLTPQNFHRHFRVYLPGDIVSFHVARTITQKEAILKYDGNIDQGYKIRDEEVQMHVPIHVGSETLRLHDVRNLRRIADGHLRDTDWEEFCPFQVEGIALWRTEPANIESVPPGPDPVKHLYASVTTVLTDHYDWLEREKKWQLENKGDEPDTNLLFI
mmetsp:Transcript_21686/g.43041  ORF Transcript_21686/g.43041 Transcript_21686/m.43041 type:complete len:294 (+) Transcript_21686:64-945(+)